MLKRVWTPYTATAIAVLAYYLPQEPKVAGRMYSVLGQFQDITGRLGKAEKAAVSGFLNALADAVMEEMVPPKK